ncbi:MAG: DMT family transporter [Hyphomicrobiaceae bacterium]
MAGADQIRKTEGAFNSVRAGIGFVVLAMFCISINDVLIKQLSGSYPLHQMVGVRSGIGILFSLFILQFEGGFRVLRTNRIGLHLLRCFSVIAANMLFFAALAAIPLADATALFFVAPLFITLLSIPVLGERVGVRRLAAVGTGFLGVLIMLRPGGVSGDASYHWLILILPVLGAFAYASMQVLTRALGPSSKASAMAVYVQGGFIITSFGFWLIAGDGRFAEGLENKSAIFLLRAWSWPTAQDWPLFVVLGLMSAVIGYALTQAYRSADATTIAPFEYVALPMSIMWGWMVFGHWPDAWVMTGIVLIAGSGVYVFIREKQRARAVASQRSLRRY